MIDQKTLNLKVNGQKYELRVPPHRTLLEVLREELKLTGAKKGCGRGECGACSVIVNNEIVASCLYLAVNAHGKEVTTIEGLGKPDRLHPIQQAFVEEGAVQCGYCTPGMVLASKALLDSKSDPSEAEIKIALGGNLCRCTGYVKILAAVKEAAKKLQNKGA